MTSSQVVLLVVGILAFQLLLWIPLLLWLRRATARLMTELGRELAGERMVLLPAPALYRGATSGSGYPRAKGNGVAALTDRRLVIRKLIGAGVELPVADIVDVREDRWFNRSAAAGKKHVIVKTRAGAEVGLFVADNAAWMDALRSLRRP